MGSTDGVSLAPPTGARAVGHSTRRWCRCRPLPRRRQWWEWRRGKLGGRAGQPTFPFHFAARAPAWGGSATWPSPSSGDARPGRGHARPAGVASRGRRRGRRRGAGAARATPGCAAGEHAGAPSPATPSPTVAERVARDPDGPYPRGAACASVLRQPPPAPAPPTPEHCLRITDADLHADPHLEPCCPWAPGDDLLQTPVQARAASDQLCTLVRSPHHAPARPESRPAPCCHLLGGEVRAPTG